MMFSSHTKMPRKVGTLQAAAILYGDWGTSKAYVIGLAFALIGPSSFWLILCVGFLNILVGLNYITICKYNPNGGGVYASAKHRSKVLALMGAFFLLADYIVTASLSALSAFYYFGVPHPETWALLAIALIGVINFFGPRYSANFALMIALPAMASLIFLGLMSLPFLGTAVENVQPLEGTFSTNWVQFVSIIVALSGIESIANITGVMKLDKGSTPDSPSVASTSKKAILIVLTEVFVLTTLFGLAVNAIPDLTLTDHTINAPGEPDVRDYMLRYMGSFFGTELFGSGFAAIIKIILSTMVGILLLSAVNTAIVALEALLFIISTDREIPLLFRRLNTFGVPFYALIIATVLPICMLFLYGDVAALADLYAVGFVGAIATNLGVTSLNKNLPLKKFERVFMFLAFLIMAAVECTLLIDKPHAAHFAISILAGGLFLRGIVVESYEKKQMSRRELLHKHRLSEQAVQDVSESLAPDLKGITIASEAQQEHGLFSEEIAHIHTGMIMCAVTHAGKTLEFALQEAKNEQQQLYVLFVREQRVVTLQDKEKEWWEDDDACMIVDYLVDKCLEIHVKFIYNVSDSPADTIISTAKKTAVSKLVLGLSRKNRFLQLLQGNFISKISKALSSNVDLIIVS